MHVMTIHAVSSLLSLEAQKSELDRPALRHPSPPWCKRLALRAFFVITMGYNTKTKGRELWLKVTDSHPYVLVVL